jgi:hypothetical protein
LKRRISLSISLRNSAVLSVLVGTLTTSAWADPPAKPAAPAAAAPAAKPAAPGAKAADPAAKAAPPAAKAADPAAKAAVPAAKAAAPAKAPDPAAKVAAPAAPKPRPKVVVAPPKPAAVVVPPAGEPAVDKDEVTTLRAEAKALSEDVKRLRADLNHALGTQAVNANRERAELEAELAEAQKKRASIQAAIDAGLDSSAVADSITNSDARIAQLDFALSKRVEAQTTRSLAEVSADVQRLDAAIANQKAATSTGTVATSSSTPPKPAPDVAPSEVTISKTGFFQPSATLQVWAIASHLANDATPNESWTNTLRIRRAELKIKGEIIRKTFGYSVMFDPARLLDFTNKTIPVTGEAPAPTTAGSVSVAQPPAGGATSILQDVALTYMNDYADVSVGQFKIPVSLEGSGSAAKLYFPERALISRKYGDRRDIGVKAEKKFDDFGYTLGLYNGEGQNKLDSNDQKDLTLRLEVYPVKDITLAVVGYTSLTERNEVGTKDRVEGDVKVEKHNVLLQAEYIRGWDMTGTPALHKRIQGQGFYVMAGYTFFDKLQPVVRVGSLDPEIGQDEHGAKAPDANDETTSYELGANYYFKGHDAKLQLAGGIFDPEQRSQHTRFDLTLAAQLAF